jgi:hypothetical protein
MTPRFRLLLAVTTATLLSATSAYAQGKIAPPPSKRVVEIGATKVQFGTKLKDPVKFQHTLPNGQTVAMDSGHEIPGLIVKTMKGVKDPKKVEITPQAAHPEKIEKPEAFLDEVKKEFGARAQYLAASDVSAAAQPYVAVARKQQILTAYAKLLAKTRMSPANKSRSLAALEQLRSRLHHDVDHKPPIGEGVAQDYHPYWSPFNQGIELLHSVAHEEVKFAVRNVLSYIARRKTALGGYEIKEWDAETSLGLRICADTDDQESVSMKKGTENDYLPTYVTMRLKTSGLPTDLAPHAGKAVYRVGADLYLDGTGQKLSASADQHVVEKQIEYADMTLRQVRSGEKIRDNFKFDWTGSGGIEPTPVDISWWGHCHIEAPLAALGVEAKTKVTYFNAASKKEKTFDPDRSNDLLFTLFDTERMVDPRSGRQKQLDKTTFVGARNDALEGFGDQLRVKTDRGEITVETRLHQIFKAGAPGPKPIDQTFLFQRKLASATGLAPNPEYVKKIDGDVHIIKGDRKVVAEIKFPEWDSQGFERERRQWVTIDPTAPGRVLITAQIQRQGNAGGVLTKYYLNLRDKTIESLSWKGERTASGFKRTLINTINPGAAPAGEEFAGISGMPKFDIVAKKVAGFNLAREVTKEGAEAIGAFVEDAIVNNQGAVVETSPDGPVWNFPMRNAKASDVTKTPPPQDKLFASLERPFERIAMTANNRQTVVARTRGANGKVKDAEFEAPFLDFAWRPERWHALPFARGLVNYDALKRGYLFKKDTQGQISMTDGFYGMATDVLYLSMVDPSKKQLWGIRHNDGKLEYFDSQQAYKTAVAALP